MFNKLMATAGILLIAVLGLASFDARAKVFPSQYDGPKIMLNGGGDAIINWRQEGFVPVDGTATVCGDTKSVEDFRESMFMDGYETVEVGLGTFLNTAAILEYAGPQMAADDPEIAGWTVVFAKPTDTDAATLIVLTFGVMPDGCLSGGFVEIPTYVIRAALIELGM